MPGWKFAAVALALLTSLLAQERREFVEPHMGTLFRIVVYSVDSPAAAARAAFAHVAELNRTFSDYDETSELSRLCRQPAGTPVPVSADLFSILQISQDLAAKTDGAFDVTLGPVIRLGREARRTRKLPGSAALAAARAASGFAHLRLDPAAQTVTLLRPGMALDLGGLAKGYAADAALAVLTRLGFPAAMVSASGDLALGDPPPGKPGWAVELAPFGDAADPRTTLVLARVGISTSGDAEQFTEIGGARYSHIVDPATGLGLTRSVAITVVAPRATLSDALATAGCVLDPAAAQRLADGWPESVRLIIHHRDPVAKFTSP